jgi:hypothetical protein
MSFRHLQSQAAINHPNSTRRALITGQDDVPTGAAAVNATMYVPSDPLAAIDRQLTIRSSDLGQPLPLQTILQALLPISYRHT